MLSGHKFGELHEAIDLDQLEAEYGGNNEWTYQYEKDWDKEDKAFPIFKEDLEEEKDQQEGQ